MSVQVSRGNIYSIISLKMMYYYGMAFGIVCFTLTDDGRLKHSLKTHIFSIVFRLSCLIGLLYFLPKHLQIFLEDEHIHVRVIFIIQVVSLIMFTVLFFLFQAIEVKQFIDLANRTIDIFDRISRISKDSTIYGHELYVMVFGRFACNVSVVMADLPKILDAVDDHHSVFVLQCILRYILWFGTVIVVDIMCLGYITAAGMYRNIGNHMISFAKRIKKSESCSLTKFRQMQLLCDFSEELDECSAIYSQIFMVTKEFHKLFQFYTLFTFYVDLLIIIANIHQAFLVYMADGVILWSVLAVSLIQAVDFLFLMTLVDLVMRRSRIPKYLNLDVLCSDIESRWDQSVEHFLNQSRFEDLKFDVYGLFVMNNELVLTVFSAIVTYLTILIQFRMMGFFREDS